LYAFNFQPAAFSFARTLPTRHNLLEVRRADIALQDRDVRAMRLVESEALRIDLEQASVRRSARWIMAASGSNTMSIAVTGLSAALDLSTQPNRM